MAVNTTFKAYRLLIGLSLIYALHCFHCVGWANEASISQGVAYEVVKPKTPAEITRYNQFVNAFNEGVAFRKVGQNDQALASYEKAYTAWPSLDVAEVILGVLDSTHQWDVLAQRITQFPQTHAYKPLRDFFTASCVEQQGMNAFKAQQWTEAVQQWQLAHQQLQPLLTDPHFGPRAIAWDAAMQKNIQIAQGNSAGSAKREQYVKETINQEDNDLYFVGLGQRRRIDFVWNPAYYPIRVYTQPGDAVSGFDADWQPLVQKALEEWQTKSHGLVKFAIVPTEEASDISIRWTPSLTQPDKGEEDPQRVGLTSTRFLGDAILTDDIEIATHDPDGSKPHLNQVYTTLLHELGHAIGLGHHSPSLGDIMSPLVSNDDNVLNRGLSTNDVALLRQQYFNPPAHVLLANNSAASRNDRLWASEQLTLASDLMKKKKYKKAMAVLQKTDAILPNMAAVHFPLMVCYLQRKKTKQLEAMVASWQTREPNNPITAFAQGFLEERLAHKAFGAWDWTKATLHFGNAALYFARVPSTSIYYEQAQQAALTARKNIVTAQENARQAATPSFQMKSGVPGVSRF